MVKTNARDLFWTFAFMSFAERYQMPCLLALDVFMMKDWLEKLTEFVK
jgi:hypothetical protein